MEEKKLPKVTHSAKIQLGDVEIEVCNLDNGQRVVTEEGVANLIKWLHGEAGESSKEQMKNLAEVLKGVRVLDDIDIVTP